MGRTVSLGQAGSAPHGSSTTPAQARGMVELLCATLQATIAEHDAQGQRYARLLATAAAAGSGSLGGPGVVEEIGGQVAGIVAAAPLLTGLQERVVALGADLVRDVPR